MTDSSGVGVTVRLAESQVERLDELVEESEFLNRSDCVRTAVRRFLVGEFESVSAGDSE